MGRRRGKGGDSRNASRGAPPLARCCAPCSVCISTVGMIVGAEAGHCPAWIFLSIERETDGGEEEKKAGTERGSGSEDDPRPLPDPQTPAVTGAFVRGWRGPLPPPWQQRKKNGSPLPSPWNPLRCDKVRVQTLSGGPGGSQTGLGSDIAGVFFCV